MTIIRAGEHRRMPWKNGGGETIEIAVAPPGASLEDFDWRVSLARVASDGPFSRFPGIDRTLAVVEGRGMVLTIEDRDHVLAPTTPPFAFAGDVATTARLVDGPLVDLNAMTRRGRWSHAVTRLDQPAAIAIGAPGQVTVVIARSALRVRAADGDALLGVDDVAIGEAMTLEPVDALRAYVVELHAVTR